MCLARLEGCLRGNGARERERACAIGDEQVEGPGNEIGNGLGWEVPVIELAGRGIGE